MKKLFSLLSFALAISALHAQTNVSGGIYSNTTWTLANSPYIVVDTVVVFPGVTLTIEPGVVVKFDDGLFLEMRNATLIAVGTATDSIIFTSNSAAPVPGIWGGGNGGILMNGSTSPSAFNFWKVEYATVALSSVPISIKNSVFLNNQTGILSVNVPVDSCIFKFNGTGIGDIHGSTVNSCNISNNSYGIEILENGLLEFCTLDSNQSALGGISGMVYGSQIQNCTISYNQTGVHANFPQSNQFSQCVINYNSVRGLSLGVSASDQVTDCEIRFNGIGLSLRADQVVTNCDIENNNIGIQVFNVDADIHCNRICNNTSSGLQLSSSSPFNVPNNFWCTPDSASTEGVIYDGYDNVAYGLVTFMPIDTLGCSQNAVSDLREKLTFMIYPNPTKEKFTIVSVSSLQLKTCYMNILNPLGEIVYSEKLTGPEEQLINPHLASGIYFVQLISEKGTFNGKLIFE